MTEYEVDGSSATESTGTGSAGLITGPRLPPNMTAVVVVNGLQVEVE